MKSKKIVRMECKLYTRGTLSVNADLLIEDPDDDIGLEILEKALKNESNDN